MKKIITAVFCIIIILSFVSCKTAQTEVKSVNTNEQTEVQKAAAEKAAALDKKAQQGYQLFFQKKYKEAIALEDMVIKEDPSLCKAYYIKGITQCYDGNYSEGSANIDKALKLNPNDYMARFNKALSLELYKHYDEALVWYNKALEIQKEEWSYYGIASIYGRRGDAANTVKYLKLAIDLNPEIKNEAKNEADFNPVKNNGEFIKLINN